MTSKRIRTNADIHYCFFTCTWERPEPNTTRLKFCVNRFVIFDRIVTGEYSGRTNLVMISVATVLQSQSWWAVPPVPHKRHVEHHLCNPGGGVYFAALLGSDNSYTTP